jgi:hypothetical protein
VAVAGLDAEFNRVLKFPPARQAWHANASDNLTYLGWLMSTSSLLDKSAEIAQAFGSDL